MVGLPFVLHFSRNSSPDFDVSTSYTLKWWSSRVHCLCNRSELSGLQSAFLGAYLIHSHATGSRCNLGTHEKVIDWGANVPDKTPDTEEEEAGRQNTWKLGV